jgi:hypothetical protein
MFIAALFIIAKPTSPITDECEFYSSTKRNEIFSFGGKWMKLKNI